MGAMVSQITGLTIVYSTIYSGTDQRKHQSSASLTFVRGIHRWPVNSSHKWPVARKMFPLYDVIMEWLVRKCAQYYTQIQWRLSFACVISMSNIFYVSPKQHSMSWLDISLKRLQVTFHKQAPTVMSHLTQWLHHWFPDRPIGASLHVTSVIQTI